MYKILLVSIFIAGFAVSGRSQTKTILTAIIKTPNALCENCKKRIEAYAKPYDGILEINVNYRKGETKVKYITDRINIEEIKAYIANCGYDADDVLAAEDAYNRLPKPCKKSEDGGTHPKPKPVQPPAH
ncbi:MAG TPA: cation transporter [Chitinophagaceae bacterium]|nr:cation transporter [Chitinophagaceae bacterium]